MTLHIKLAAAAVVALAGAGILCPICRDGVSAAAAQTVLAAEPADTATVMLHISGMTCGSCPTTARIALNRLPGVLKATVTLDDSLGVVHYDPEKVTPAQIADHLTKRTGYGARIIERPATPRPS